jgi:xanthine dehydrogenase YagS FAD-binding subunit
VRPFAYARPRSLEDAVRVLPGAAALGGGTDLFGLMKDGVAAPDRVVDLSALESLRGWSREPGSGLRIGALTRLIELETDPDFVRALPIAAEALALAATPQLRAMGTVGGNLLQRNRCWYFRDESFPCWLKGGERCFAAEGDDRYHAILGANECVMVAPSDLAPALIALDATVELRSSSAARRVPLADLYRVPSGADRREHTLGPDEVLTEVRVPESALERSGRFAKAMDRKAWSFALVSVAAAARVEQGRARDVRVILGGVAPIPWRAREAEEIVADSALDESACAAAAEAAVAAARPLSRNGYKVPLARELVRRTLRSLAPE